MGKSMRKRRTKKVRQMSEFEHAVHQLIDGPLTDFSLLRNNHLDLGQPDWPDIEEGGICRKFIPGMPIPVRRPWYKRLYIFICNLL